MNPDLRKSHISDLAFFTSCFIPEEVRNEIKRLSPPSNRTSRFFDVYVHNRVTHRCVLSIEFKKGDTGPSLIHLEYLRRPTKKLPKKVPTISDIINTLCLVEGEHDFTCFSTVEYPKMEKKRFIVHLPLKISESSKMPINSINGLSIDGIVESQKYSSLLMVTPTGDHVLTLLFNKKYSFSESLPHSIISEINKITDTLVF